MISFKDVKTQERKMRNENEYQQKVRKRRIAANFLKVYGLEEFFKNFGIESEEEKEALKELFETKRVRMLNSGRSSKDGYGKQI